MKGKPIKTMKKMMALSKRAIPVWFHHHSGVKYRTNSAFVVNYPAHVLFKQLEAGYYFEYVKKSKNKK